MKSLNNISLFRVILFSIISAYFNNIFLYIACFIFLLIIDYKESLIYLFLIFLIILINRYSFDFMPIGIIESDKESYYIVDKLFYKIKLITDDDLKIGDLLFFNDQFNSNSYENELKKNILYYGYDYKYLFSFKLKYLIYEKVVSFDSNISSYLLKFLYNINNYDDITFDLGYGLSSYYLFKKIYKKKRYIGIGLILIYSLLFVMHVKYYLIIIDFILDILKVHKSDRNIIIILIIYIMNRCLLLNYSILIPVLISLYNNIDISLDFKGFFAILESLLFGEINIFYSLFYRLFIRIHIILFIFSLLMLIIPGLEILYVFLIKIYANIYNLDFSLRGSISILSIFIFIYLIKSFNIDNNLIKYLIILLLIILPTNHPFGHVSFIDVGQGDATLIKLPLNQGNVLIDTGSKYNYYKLKKYLYKQGIYNIDYLVITHDDSDHNGNLESLKSDFNIKNIITDGQDFNLKQLYFKYYDLGEYENDNDNSLVYGLSVNGLNYLFTGDISYLTEKMFIKEYGPIHFDVLKVSHHGSYTASSKYFIGNILPKYAAISTSGQYGHPAQSTIENLESYLVNYYVTKQDKNVEFYFILGLNIIKSGLRNFVIIM